MLQHSYHRWKIFVRATLADLRLEKIIEHVVIELDECYQTKIRILNTPKKFTNENLTSNGLANSVEVQEFRLEEDGYKSFKAEIRIKFKNNQTKKLVVDLDMSDHSRNYDSKKVEKAR